MKDGTVLVMAEPSDERGDVDLPTQPAPTPSNLRSQEAKERFAISKFYGMGSDGKWEIEEIAEEMDKSVRQVYRYIHESQMGEQVREMLATTEAEWRLEMALSLRQEVQRLEEMEQELLQRKKAVPVSYEDKTVQGTPTGDRNISLDDHASSYQLKIPVPSDYETVTDYGPDLERIQKEKRQYWDQISNLLGLDAADRKEVDHTLATRHEEVKIVEYRDAEDDYPDQDVIDVDGQAAQIEQDDEEDAEDA